NMKLGNFSISFEDMSLNINNLPVSVIRTYDSRTRYSDKEFGYGWDQSFTDVTVQASCVQGENWDEKAAGSWITTYYLDPIKSHKVTIDLGNGKSETFNMKLSPSQSKFYPLQYGISAYYEPVNKSKSTLVPTGIDTTDLIYIGGVLYTFDLEVFDPQQYVYTTADGSKYLIDVNNGLQKMTDAYGTTMSFTDKGIISSDGRSIMYTYDKNGRIASVSDPSGKYVQYEYNTLGDLISFINEKEEKTSFVYTDHYLTEIIDPRGVRVTKNVYDDDGRIIKTIDADGNETAYEHDIDGRQEIITDKNGGVTKYNYDCSGNMLSKTDPQGSTVTCTYDANGNPETVTDALGNVINYKYDCYGNILSQTDAAGHTVTNEYDSKGQLVSINAMGIKAISVSYDEYSNLTSTADALGNTTNYKYDRQGRLTSVTDEIGSYKNMTYDQAGNVISTVDASGSTDTYTYDKDGNCTSRTTSFSSGGEIKTVKESYVYDEAGQLVKIIDNEGNITSTEYNVIGKISCQTDPQGRQTKYEYDNVGNLVKITYPDATTEKFTYDKEGNNLTATDRSSRTVTMEYDKVGNLISRKNPDGSQISYSYDKNYNLISETGVNGGQTSYEYDSTGKNTAITDELSNRTEFTYNELAQLSQMKDKNGNIVRYEYDLNGNRIKTIYPDNTTSESEYDARGRQVSTTDPNGYKTYYEYDNGDRLSKVTDAIGNITGYAYDQEGNLISVTDANNNTTTYTYDNYGRTTKVTNALGQSSQMTYDAQGNILTSTDFGGNLTTYTYDDKSQMTSQTTADGTVYYSYTSDSKLSQVRDNSGTITFQYDKNDGLTRVSYPNGRYVEYKYDQSGNITSMATPFGTTSYEYDLAGKMTKVTDRNGYETQYEYDANGSQTAVKYANGITVSYNYDALNRLISESTLDSTGRLVAQYDYTLGLAGEQIKIQEYNLIPPAQELPAEANGDISEVTQMLTGESSPDELNRTVEYTYDALYRLTGEKITEGEETTEYTYAYDNVSNRISRTENGEETTSTYNELNQLISEGETTYEYDECGNTVKISSPDKVILYSYNAKNKLIKAQVSQGDEVSEEEYEYDYAGNRTVKKTASDYTYYLNDINSQLTQVTAELERNGSEKCYYTRGNSLISQERSGNTNIYLYDGHGSVRQLSDMNAEVTDSYVYDSWGNLLSSTGSTENSYKYCGESNDTLTGLYYLRARYMDTSTGRFITQDTYPGSLSDPVTLHRYMYANANPVSNADPSGNCAVLMLAGNVKTPAEIQYDETVIKIGLALIAALTVIIAQQTKVFDTMIMDMTQGITQGTMTFTDWLNKIKEKITARPVAIETYGERKDNDRVYYHATTLAAAALIVATMTLLGSVQEGGYVFAWELRPSKKALRLSGAKSANVIIAFSTYASFEPDWGINLPEVLLYRPVCSVLRLPVHINKAVLFPV
ncbi:MAG: RHS repeat-associated core domain-containing protein, partial [Oscillospiraceae bacterium]|nr:RHS repeat-associated core domain-containing protein [Oscillospiraceae bacterium]